MIIRFIRTYVDTSIYTLLCIYIYVGHVYLYVCVCVYSYMYIIVCVYSIRDLIVGREVLGNLEGEHVPLGQLQHQRL